MKQTQRMERIPRQKNMQSKESFMINGELAFTSMTSKELKKLIIPMECKMHNKTYKKTEEGIVML